MSEYRVLQNRSDELYHYGVLGMKWGVRRTSEQLGHTKPTRQERKTRRKLTKDLTAAQKYAKQRVRMDDDAQNAADEASKQYRKALSKTTLPWNNKKKQQAINEASDMVQRTMTELQEARWKSDRAIKIGKEKEEALKGYVDALTEKYGMTNVKQLKTKYMRSGENFVLETYKTGLHTENFPVLGNMVSAKKINQWESQIREEILEKRTESIEKNRYA